MLCQSGSSESMMLGKRGLAAEAAEAAWLKFIREPSLPSFQPPFPPSPPNSLLSHPSTLQAPLSPFPLLPLLVAGPHCLPAARCPHPPPPLGWTSKPPSNTASGSAAELARSQLPCQSAAPTIKRKIQIQIQIQKQIQIATQDRAQQLLGPSRAASRTAPTIKRHFKQTDEKHIKKLSNLPNNVQNFCHSQK